MAVAHAPPVAAHAEADADKPSTLHPFTQPFPMSTFPSLLSSRTRRNLCLALALGCCLTVSAADTGKTFATPEEAVTALTAAAKDKNLDALRALFGPAAADLENPDRVQAANELAAFAQELAQNQRLTRPTETQCVLEVGAALWPFSVPLAKGPNGWYFDTVAGKDEVLSRRIGKNELSTLQSVRAYVDAQRDYASKDRDGDQVLEYAQRFISHAGKQDGLYWPLELNGELSPLGPLMAQAQGEGYSTAVREDDAPRQPFHGYYFKILTRQAKSAPGGKYDYLINGNLIGGFALVAWPAEYGETGIMTFIVNQQGKVYQKDLGPKTGRLAKSMKAYDPDASWTLSRD